MRFGLVLALIGSPALADYSDHSIVRLFTNEPCTRAVAEIDQSFSHFHDRGLEGAADMVGAMTRQAMAWGFLLGFDAAEGGLHSEAETTLMRLRAACAENPDHTALSILQQFDQD